MSRRADTRVAITLRLPYDQYREMVVRARKREWSLNHYASYCIGRELQGRSKPDRTRVANLNKELLREDAADALGQ